MGVVEWERVVGYRVHVVGMECCRWRVGRAMELRMRIPCGRGQVKVVGICGVKGEAVFSLECGKFGGLSVLRGSGFGGCA